MQTRDQKYAQDAFERVMEISKQEISKQKKESFSKAYGSMAHKLPILIHVSGLAQALAFVSSRGKDKGSGQLLEDLSQTVLNEPVACLLARSRGNAQEGGLRDYLYLTEQTLAALLWYKRYAQSILNVEQGDLDAESALEGETK